MRLHSVAAGSPLDSIPGYFIEAFFWLAACVTGLEALTIDPSSQKKDGEDGCESRRRIRRGEGGKLNCLNMRKGYMMPLITVRYYAYDK